MLLVITSNAFLNFIYLTKFYGLIKTWSNVIKINCSNCDAFYVEQTKRLLNSRISEHRNHIKRNFTQISVITNHRLDLDHDFDWDNVEIG